MASTVVGISFIRKAPDDSWFVVPELGSASVSKKFALFHCLMGRIVVMRNGRRC